MGLNTAAVTAQLNGLTAKFDEGARIGAPFYPKLCTIRPSNKAEEKFAWLGAMPGMEEWLGDRKFKQLRAADYSLDNILWEESIAIEKTHIEDDQLGLYADPMAQLGEDAAGHPDELLVTTLNNAESEECFDGQFFFDTDHSWGDSGTQSNDLTASIAGASPTVEEFRDAVRVASRTMLTYKRDNGKYYARPTVGRLSGLTLVISPELRDVAYETFESVLIGNSTNVVIDRPEIVVMNGIASNKIYLFRTNQRLKPFVFQARRALRRQMKGVNDNEFKDVKFMADARYNMGYLAWWNAVLTTLT